MTEASPKFLRAQVARIRRLIRDLTDQRARQALLALAEEYDARAAALERQADQNPEGAVGSRNRRAPAEKPGPRRPR